jgi:antitoxin (DNA-binding transcriptional repressor) of toxin-antitoxin stability system
MFVTMIVTMKTIVVNLSDAKAHLAEYARRVKKGDRVILCDRNRPFAEIRALRLTPEGRRPFGLAKGRFTVPDDVAGSDTELLELFGGGGGQ